MSSILHRAVHRWSRWLTLGLGTLSLVIVTYAFGVSGMPRMEGRLLPPQLQKQQKWVTHSAADLEKGVSLQADTNTIIHIPDSVTRITRKTLFGQKGKDARYWGYCFPVNYDREYAMKRSGFPGTLFLSEKERDLRSAQSELNRRAVFSVYENLNQEDLNREREERTTIRHQIEIFTGGQSCYVMTETVLPVGIDIDDDGANSAIEREHGSDAEDADSDSDGVTDGLEIFRLGTFASKRDSDGDGLIDGIEDGNKNGRFDEDETNPMLWDTDRDGLCDGLCKVNKGKELRGEDKNLNGLVDDEETDPRKVDTDGNGVLDEQEYFNCILANGADC